MTENEPFFFFFSRKQTQRQTENQNWFPLAYVERFRLCSSKNQTDINTKCTWPFVLNFSTFFHEKKKPRTIGALMSSPCEHQGWHDIPWFHRAFDINHDWNYPLLIRQAQNFLPALPITRSSSVSIGLVGPLEWSFSLSVGFGNNDKDSNQQLPPHSLFTCQS